MDALIAAGIAYNSEWESGDDYGEGCQSCRFTAEGSVVVKEVYSSDYSVPLNLLMEAINTPNKLREIILGWKEKITVLPWDNQEEYGKLYRATMLITT